MSTKIEWTHVPDGKGGFKKGETLGFQVGCKEVSPACRRCYAAKLAHRGMSKQHKGLTVMRETGGVHWNGEINRVPDALVKPLHWREPRGVFVGSMTDVFFDVSTEDACRWIAALFGIMAAAPQHTFMLLTKRPENAAKWFAWLSDRIPVDPGTMSLVHDVLHDAWAALTGKPKCSSVVDAIAACRRGEGPSWPLPNVWVGCTAEDQRHADERVPVLLSLPAAVRFVSYEPACGPVDWSRWIENISHCTSCGAEHEPLGDDRCPSCSDDGSIIDTWGAKQAADLRSGARYENNGPSLDDDGPQLHWIIAGGESGPGAQPSHPDWFRSTRDQCESAGIAFFFKQWGEWSPASADVWCAGRFPDDVARAGEIVWSTVVESSSKKNEGKRWPWAVSPEGRFDRLFHIGKAEAGREIDGRTHDGFPEAR